MSSDLLGIPDSRTALRLTAAGLFTREQSLGSWPRFLCLGFIRRLKPTIIGEICVRHFHNAFTVMM